MYITMCLYITITIMLWVLSIYPFIKHYSIVILCYPYNLVISTVIFFGCIICISLMILDIIVELSLLFYISSALSCIV